jgi:hypothetical protein
MRDYASSNFTKFTIVKAGSTSTSPERMGLFPHVKDLQSSISLPNRPRMLSLEFHSSPRPLPLPLIPLLPRNLSKKHQVTPDSMDVCELPPVKDINLCIRPKVLDARTARALGLVPSPLMLPLPSPLSSPLSAELPLLPRAADQNKDEMCFTPAPSFESRDVWMPPPRVPEREELRILHSPTMPRELFVPDDFSPTMPHEHFVPGDF